MFFTLNRYWIFLLLLLTGYVLFEYYRPKPLDWSSSYSNKDNIPFGGEVLFALLPDIVGHKPVTSVRVPPYNQLEKYAVLSIKSSYVFIKDDFSVDENDQKSLLSYAKRGNSVFISAYDFPDTLMHALGVTGMLHDPSPKDTAKYINFVNPGLKDKKGYIFPKDDGRNYFKVLDTKNTLLLATNENKEPVFVRVNYGRGYFYLHNLPLAFTNYYVLDPATRSQAFKALSYLPQQPVYWDEYQKQGLFEENQSSVFRYIVSQPGLKTAYLMSLAALLLYAIFSGKRQQRIIPIMNPPKNVSLEFVKTIGNMYYRKSDHANLAEKLVQQFWMYARERFGINTNQSVSDDLVKDLSEKSGLSNIEMREFFNEISGENQKWTGERLMLLNQRLDDFYERTR